MSSRRTKRSSRSLPNKQRKLRELLEACDLSKKAQCFLELSVETSGLNTRSVMKMLSLSRTIADLGQSLVVEEEHIAEAYALRFQTYEL